MVEEEKGRRKKKGGREKEKERKRGSGGGRDYFIRQKVRTSINTNWLGGKNNIMLEKGGGEYDDEGGKQRHGSDQ